MSYKWDFPDNNFVPAQIQPTSATRGMMIYDGALAARSCLTDLTHKQAIHCKKTNNNTKNRKFFLT